MYLKKAIRIITDAKYNAHSSPLFKELKILNIQDEHLFNICKFMYDYHHSTLPNALSNIFQSVCGGGVLEPKMGT